MSEPTPLEIFNETGVFPSDDKASEALMREVLGENQNATGKPDTSADEVEAKQPALDLGALLEQERQARRQAEADREALLQEANARIASYADMIDRLSKQQQPTQETVKAVEQGTQISDLINKLKANDEDWLNPDLITTVEAIANLSQTQLARLAAIEQAMADSKAQQVYAYEQTQKAETDRYQQAINANPQLAEWQKNPQDWKTVQDLWPTIANSLKLQALPLEDQLAKLTTMAETVLGKSDKPLFMPPNTDAKPAPKAAPKLYSIGDIPGSGVETTEGKSLKEMKGDDFAVVDNMNDKQFEAFISGRRV